MKRSSFQFEYLLLLPLAWELFGACREFFNVAWGTGAWLGEFSLKWGILFFAFTLFCVAIFLLAILWRPLSLWERIRVRALRERGKHLRYPLAILALFFPVLFFQYTLWGIVFQGMYIRVLVWAIVVLFFTVIVSKGNDLAGWNEFLAALVLTSSIFTVAATLVFVNNYPFSRGWSEGNRLWDYSILFGRDLYDYPANQGIPVLLDLGRQFVGGLPFIFGNVGIGAARLWVALTFVFPYLLLGLAAFRALAGAAPCGKEKKTWLIMSLWIFLFLKQGPIHPPLVLSAALTALAWNAPLGFAIPLIAGAGYVAYASRASWMFAPAIWIVMLEFVGANFANFKIKHKGTKEYEGGKFSASTFVNFVSFVFKDLFADFKKAKSIWTRSIILGAIGIFGGFIFPFYVKPTVREFFQSPAPIVSPVESAAPTPPVAPPDEAPSVASSPTLLDTMIALLTTQPLLWYRLLPNSTYKNGILISLALAILPLLIILIYFSILYRTRQTLKVFLSFAKARITKRPLGFLLRRKCTVENFSIKKLWQITRLQKFALILPLLVFFVIGLIASAKIGGGGDLHNMDMFLIALMFTGVIAWHNGGREWIQNGAAIPLALKVVIVLMLTFPALSPLREMYAYNFGEDAAWLAKLADKPSAKSLDMLPTQKTADEALQIIREEIALAKSKGEILFIDQRQLLTFDYVEAPLISEYEKKVLMNEALSANADYFKPFYADLAKRRFSLIISEPLRGFNKDAAFQFGEENDDWVTWVSTPILCYYESKIILDKVGVQLLVPMPETAADCPNPLPTGNQP